MLRMLITAGVNDMERRKTRKDIGKNLTKF
jgi:hypothetical protein